MTDIKAHCCGADQLFDEKTAKKQYRKYLKKGPSSVTKKLIGQMSKTDLGESLIDVGGGIGAIQWWFLQNGGHSTVGVDASSGYTNLAKEHAAKNSHSESSRFLIGDFIDVAANLPKADHVSLDKVICCYPNYEAIVNAACSKAQRTVSLSFPMDGFISDIFRSFGVLYMKLNGIPFKPYIHHVASVRELFAQNGFTMFKRDLSFPWHIETYRRAK